MAKSRKGAQTHTFSTKLNTNTNYLVCYKCGKNIGRSEISINMHKKTCGIETNRKIKCLKVFNANAVIHIFYYKGKLHCLNTSMLAKKIDISSTLLNNRLRDGWTYERLFTDTTKPNKEKKSPIKGNCHKLPDGTLDKQKLLMKVFKQKR